MASKRYAILIASSRYPDEPGLTPLRCPENDVDALNEVLSSPDFGQFAKVDVFKNAPSHEVLEQIETVLHEADREDLVLLYFSGHGKLNAFCTKLYLTTVNTKLKALGSTSIPIEQIKSFFEAAATRTKILILDCCYSGNAGEAFTSTKGSITDQLQFMSSQGQGTFIMTASARFQEAEEKPGDSLGLFTKHLVEGIRSGEADRDEDGFVDIHELYQHVYEKVRAEGKQEPMKWDINAKGRMIIARSGKDAKEKQRQELRAKLCGLAAQGRLSDSVLTELRRLLASNAPELTIVAELAAALHSSVNRDAAQLPVAPPAPPLSEESEQLPRQKASPQKSRTIGQYIDHGDGTITDTKTGLMWKRCAEGLFGVNCEEGKLEEYTWDDAVERFKNVEYARYADWRLPTLGELKTLLHCSKGKNKNNGCCNDGSAVPTINQQAFPNTPATWFWSGSPYAAYSDGAWHVGFGVGLSSIGGRNGYGAVRLVRGGQ